MAEPRGESGSASAGAVCVLPPHGLDVGVFEARTVSARQVASNVREIRLRLVEPREISFRAGQYIRVEVPGLDGPVYRDYSISSPQQQRRVIELVVRRVPGGRGATYLWSLNVGDPVRFIGPFGTFRLTEDASVELVCVAGGCGVAPLRSIIYTLYQRWHHRKCRLFLGVRSIRDAPYLEEFQALARRHPSFRVVYAVSEHPSPEDDWRGEVGLIHQAVERHLEPGGKRQAFLCGPTEMLEAVKRVLTVKGVRDIYHDEY